MPLQIPWIATGELRDTHGRRSVAPLPAPAPPALTPAGLIGVVSALAPGDDAGDAANDIAEGADCSYVSVVGDFADVVNVPFAIAHGGEVRRTVPWTSWHAGATYFAAAVRSVRADATDAQIAEMQRAYCADPAAAPRGPPHGGVQRVAAALSSVIPDIWMRELDELVAGLHAETGAAYARVLADLRAEVPREAAEMSEEEFISRVTPRNQIWARYPDAPTYEDACARLIADLRACYPDAPTLGAACARLESTKRRRALMRYLPRGEVRARYPGAPTFEAACALLAADAAAPPLPSRAELAVVYNIMDARTAAAMRARGAQVVLQTRAGLPLPRALAEIAVDATVTQPGESRAVPRKRWRDVFRRRNKISDDKDAAGAAVVSLITLGYTVDGQQVIDSSENFVDAAAFVAARDAALAARRGAPVSGALPPWPEPGAIVPVCFSASQVCWADGWVVHACGYPAVRPEHPDDRALLERVALGEEEASLQRPVYAVLT